MCDRHDGTRLWNLLAVVLLIQHVAAGVLSGAHSERFARRALDPLDFDFDGDGGVHVALALAKRDKDAAATVVTGADNSADNGDNDNDNDENANANEDRDDRNERDDKVEDDSAATQGRRAMAMAMATVASPGSDVDGVDFVAYENDFNMQDEASIPEDIVDQQHIQDGDIIAADMLYGESEAADIVLESQRSTSKNCTSYDSNSSSSSSSGSFKNKKPKIKSNKTKTNNNDRPRRKDIDEMGGSSVPGGSAAGEKKPPAAHMPSWLLQRWPPQQEQMVREDEDEEETETEMEPEQRLAEAQQAQQKIDEAAGILNKRKFNKVASIHDIVVVVPAAAATAADENRNGKAMATLGAIRPMGGGGGGGDGVEQRRTDESAIGDIEDNFRNDDDAAWKERDDGDNDERPAEVVANAKSNAMTLSLGLSNSNGIVVIEDVRNVRRQREHETTGTLADRDRSVATEAEAKVEDDAGEVGANAEQPNFTFVERKAKRHGAPTYSRASRNGPQWTERRAVVSRKVAIDNGSSDDDVHEDDGDEWLNDDDTAAPKMHDNYSIRSLGTAATSATPTTTTTTTTTTTNTTAAAAASWPWSGEDDNGYDDGDGDGDFNAGPAKTLRRQHATATTATAPTTTTTKTTTAAAAAAPAAGSGFGGAALSAFDAHKAERRNNRRYGHRTHKKKYKDYLRYVMAVLATKATTPAGTTATAGGDAAGNRQEAGATATVNATAKRAGNYIVEQQQQQQQPRMEEGGELLAERRAALQRKYAQKMAAEKSRGLPASPIFVVGASGGRVNTLDGGAAVGVEHTTKPFYEGQINYYVETHDDDDDDDGGDIVARMRQQRPDLRSDATSDWYRRVSPMLRNGIKTTHAHPSAGESHRSHREHHYHQHYLQQQQQQQQHQLPHHYRNHPHKHHAHHSQHRQHHHQHGRHHQGAGAHGRPSAVAGIGPIATTTNSSTTTTSTVAPQLTPPSPPPPSPQQQQQQQPANPHAGAMQELGHQITEMDEFERYYAKWPHLARVQFQVYDEHFRETHPDLYPDYDYESAAELEEALNGDAADANLPPYIKKYNRRNKQLLNLLEGTLPPPTRPPPPPWRTWSSSLLQPGPHDSAAPAATVVRLDDDYLKAKRQRYHNHHRSSDLFAQQRHSDATQPPASAPAAAAPTTHAVAEQQTSSPPPAIVNQLPDDDVSVSREEQADELEQEIETKSNANEMTGSEQMVWQIDRVTTPAGAGSGAVAVALATSSGPKAAVFRLPSYPAIAGSFLSGAGKARSRSAQFAPSTGLATGRRAANMFGTPLGHKTLPRFTARDGGARSSSSSSSSSSPPSMANTSAAAAAAAAVADGGDVKGTTMSPAAGKTINSFVYHRVIDASPRLVGAGSTGRKQRLPFVAITDRRLETSKKALPPQDFEQNNHFPMP